MKSIFRALTALLLVWLMAGALGAASPGEDPGLVREHQGFWLGDRKNPNGTTTQIGVEFLTRADGSPWARVAQPAQGADEIPVKALRATGDALELDLVVPIRIRLVWQADHFQGEWRFLGEGAPAPFPLALHRVEAFPSKSRPQTPKGPFPYQELDLAIPSTDGVVLGATLTLPKGRVRPTVVVLVPGSGETNRDEAGDGHRPFAVLADHLSRQGIAVLRYDKRGIARSTGSYEQHTNQQLAEDLTAIVKAMHARHQFQAVGIIAHSEGPGIAATVAGQHRDQVAFVVSLAGLGLPALEALLLQDASEAKGHGATEADIARVLPYVRKHYETILAHADPGPRMVALHALMKTFAEERALLQRLGMASQGGSLDPLEAEKPHLRALLMEQPQAVWSQVHCPVLVMNGSLDTQVPPENAKGIAKALKAGGNTQVDLVVLPGLNHLFQTAQTGSVEEYGKIQETFAPAALSHMSAFIQALRHPPRRSARSGTAFQPRMDHPRQGR